MTNPPVDSLGAAPFDWISLAVSTATFALGVVVSFVIYKISKRVDFRSRMRRTDELRSAVSGLLRDWDWDSGQLREAMIMNARRHERGEYDGTNSITRHGSMYGKAELLGTRFDGVEVVAGIVNTWITPQGRRSLKKVAGSEPGPSATKVGIIPFEYIEYVDTWSDEFTGLPVIYVRFRGPGRSEHKSFFYAESGGTQLRAGGRRHYFPIDELGVERPNRLIAWLRFRRLKRTINDMDRRSAKLWKKAVNEAG
jgi:hypothetical protein